ncbi:hypothetical protein D3C87_2043160 [compost metagenome]
MAGFCFFFVLFAVVGDGVAQSLLLSVTIFAGQLGVFAELDQQFVHMGDNTLFHRRIHAGNHFI